MPEFGGKNVILTPDDPPSSYDELAELLSVLNVRDGLRVLGHLFAQLQERTGKSAQIDAVLVPSFAIPPLALELILSSDDTHSGQITDDVLAKLVRCFHALPWPDMEGDSAFELLLRMGPSQLSFQRNDPHLLARTLRVFGELWRTVPQAQGLDLSVCTKAAFGLDVEETLIVGFAFATRARQGYVSPYQGIDESHRATRIFTPEAQGRFLDSLSSTYDAIRRKARATEPVNASLRKARFNPLAITPLVIPDIQPPAVSERVYLVPCTKFLADRISDGLVLDCRRVFGNAFNDAFGHVVERYVGGLLVDAFGDTLVRGDFNYRVAKTKFRSPDWTVIGTRRAVVIEVKKSLLFPKARSTGSLVDVRQDLQASLGKAIAQLTRFRKHVRSIRDYPDGKDIELVVATWDDHWWANSILMQQVSQLAMNSGVHVMSVRELERLLTVCGSPDALYETLWSKRCAGADHAQMDMGDWLSRRPGGVDLRPVPSLARVYAEFFQRWGIRPAGAAPT